jgi:hypothetical protein
MFCNISSKIYALGFALMEIKEGILIIPTPALPGSGI